MMSYMSILELQIYLLWWRVTTFDFFVCNIVSVTDFFTTPLFCYGIWEISYPTIYLNFNKWNTIPPLYRLPHIISRVSGIKWRNGKMLSISAELDQIEIWIHKSDFSTDTSCCITCNNILFEIRYLSSI